MRKLEQNMVFGKYILDLLAASSLAAPRIETSVGWPSGLRRQFQALVSSEAWVRIPLQSAFGFSFWNRFHFQKTFFKKCRDWESHPGFCSHNAGYCYYTISATFEIANMRRTRSDFCFFVNSGFVATIRRPETACELPP